MHPARPRSSKDPATHAAWRPLRSMHDHPEGPQDAAGLRRSKCGPDSATQVSRSISLTTHLLIGIRKKRVEGVQGGQGAPVFRASRAWSCPYVAPSKLPTSPQLHKEGSRATGGSTDGKVYLTNSVSRDGSQLAMPVSMLPHISISRCWDVASKSLLRSRPLRHTLWLGPSPPPVPAPTHAPQLSQGQWKSRVYRTRRSWEVTKCQGSSTSLSTQPDIFLWQVVCSKRSRAGIPVPQAWCLLSAVESAVLKANVHTDRYHMSLEAPAKSKATFSKPLGGEFNIYHEKMIIISIQIQIALLFLFLNYLN